MKIDQQNNYLFLLFALLIILLGAPIVDEFTSWNAGLIFQFGLNVTLLISIWSFVESRRVAIIVWTLVIGSTLLSILFYMFNSIWILYGFCALFLSFCLLSVRVVTLDVFFGNESTGNRIIGAVCIYLLLGLIWAILYFFLELMVPNSFAGLTPDIGLRFMYDFIYFSFVTLTTMGYGDIKALSLTARALAYLQAVTGVMYSTVLVAALVGMYTAEHAKK